MPIPTICSPLTPEWVSRERMTAVQHCHSSAMSRSAQPGCGLNAHSGRRCTPASGLLGHTARLSASYRHNLTPASIASWFIAPHPRLSADQHHRTSLTNMSRTGTQRIAKGFAVEIGDDFHARFFIPSMIFADLRRPVCADSYPLPAQMRSVPAGTPG